MGVTPEPPRNVVAVMRDGRHIPLECTYNGVRDGGHLWTVAWVLPELPVEIRCDELPGNASLGVVMALNDAAAAAAGRFDPAEIVAAALDAR